MMVWLIGTRESSWVEDIRRCKLVRVIIKHKAFSIESWLKFDIDKC